MKHFNRFTAALLFAVLTAQTVGCGSDKPIDGTQTPSTDTTTVAAAVGYAFPSLNLEGGKFSILNSTNTYGQYTTLDLEEATGDILDDAVYNRNRAMEERFHFTFDITEEAIETAHKTALSTIMAGDDVWDFMYIQALNCRTLIPDGCLAELSSIKELQLDQPWWEATTCENARIGENRELFIAANYFSLMGFDATLCMFINETTLENLNVEAPYDLVREGKWTFDKMCEYAALGANLNGDSGFNRTGDGNATYGVVTWPTGILGLMSGMEAYYSETGSDGIPHITAGSEHFLEVADRLAKNLTSVAGEFIYPEGDLWHREFFKAGRALMYIGQICAATQYRDMADNYGILPMPKYDEQQENYINLISNTQFVLCMPVTNVNVAESAQLMDAISYVSFTDVLPVYYEKNVAQKGLRNEDSIEMLDIIRETRYHNVAEVYGWTIALRNEINNKILSGDGSIASIVASHLPAAEAAIETILKQIS
ncbi:MAG: hypothetical protein IJ493_06315 [Clostridia bacterium]|nr:hypothetical protein [Clostridia bacterium]